MNKWLLKTNVSEVDLEKTLNELERQYFSIYSVEPMAGSTGATTKFRVLAYQYDDSESGLWGEIVHQDVRLDRAADLRAKYEKAKAEKKAKEAERDKEQANAGEAESVSHHQA